MTSSNDLTAGSRLRSAQWYAGDDRNAYIHRAWMRRGVPGDAFTGRPHIAHREYGLGPDAVQRPSDRGRRVGEERCVRGRRHPAGAAGGVAGRNPAPAHRDAVAQHGRDGHRGDASGQPDRRRGAARRLRQDHPVLAHGRRLGRPTRRRGARRADADRHLPRRTPGLRHRRLAAVGGGPGRHPLLRSSSPARSRP